jgi:hypothetical protein
MGNRGRSGARKAADARGALPIMGNRKKFNFLAGLLLAGDFTASAGRVITEIATGRALTSELRTVASIFCPSLGHRQRARRAMPPLSTGLVRLQDGRTVCRTHRSLSREGAVSGMKRKRAVR